MLLHAQPTDAPLRFRGKPDSYKRVGPLEPMLPYGFESARDEPNLNPIGCIYLPNLLPWYMTSLISCCDRPLEYVALDHI